MRVSMIGRRGLPVLFGLLTGYKAPWIHGSMGQRASLAAIVGSVFRREYTVEEGRPCVCEDSARVQRDIRCPGSRWEGPEILLSSMEGCRMMARGRRIDFVKSVEEGSRGTIILGLDGVEEMCRDQLTRLRVLGAEYGRRERGLHPTVTDP